MDYLFITFSHQEYVADLELPASVPFFMLVPIILKSLNWQSEPSENDSQQFIGLVKGSERIVQPNETLMQAGIVNGDIVELRNRKQPQPAQAKPSQDDEARQPYLQFAATDAVVNCPGKTTLIGRSDLAHLPNNQVVSGRHARIVWREGAYWIIDENSSNGTFVDGVQLQPQKPTRLRDRCEVQFGLTGPTLVFYEGRSNQPPN